MAEEFGGDLLVDPARGQEAGHGPSAILRRPLRPMSLRSTASLNASRRRRQAAFGESSGRLKTWVAPGCLLSHSLNRAAVAKV
jgi:hypothetical protein